MTLVFWLTVASVALPALLSAVDFLPASLQQRSKVFALDPSDPAVDDFAVLVPIYGSTKYLQNVEYLRQYGSRVTLCTTDQESEEFYADLESQAAEAGFGVFRAPFPPRKVSASGKKNTGGVIRDRVIREALRVVKAAYVVCIDADTETAVPINALVASFVRAGLDLASICVVPSNDNTLLARFQQHEYRIAMRVRRLFPWLISGACHIAKTPVHHEIMERHSLFFQGNDVELGVIGEACGFNVGHILFDVPTIVPDTFGPWWRQRCAWSGGQFRLAVVNIAYSLRLPWFFAYMSAIVTFGAPLRWLSLFVFSRGVIVLALSYVVLTMATNWKHRDLALFLYPLYALFGSMVLTPLGAYFYVQMSRKDSNWGVIRHLPFPEVRRVRRQFHQVAVALSRLAIYRVGMLAVLGFSVLAVVDASPGIAAALLR